LAEVGLEDLKFTRSRRHAACAYLLDGGGRFVTMARLERARITDLEPAVPAKVTARGAGYEAYEILHWGFTVLPIIAGIDKFFDKLALWHNYLAPTVNRLVPVDAHAFMMAIGVIEIIAGLIVAWKPKFGGYLVMLWLWAIIVNLLLIPGYYD